MKIVRQKATTALNAQRKAGVLKFRPSGCLRRTGETCEATGGYGMKIVRQKATTALNAQRKAGVLKFRPSGVRTGRDLRGDWGDCMSSGFQGMLPRRNKLFFA